MLKSDISEIMKSGYLIRVVFAKFLVGELSYQFITSDSTLLQIDNLWLLILIVLY